MHGRPQSITLGVLPALFLAAIFGCQSPQYRLVLHYADDVAWDRARYGELLVFSGDHCDELASAPQTADGDAVTKLDFSVHGASPRLGQLRYGELTFDTRVRDRDCVLFLAGCVEQEIKPHEDAIVTIDLALDTETGCPAGTVCASGQCSAAPDAGTDANAVDAGRGDALRLDTGRLDRATADTAVGDARGDHDYDGAPPVDASVRDAAIASDAGSPDAANTDTLRYDANGVDRARFDGSPPDSAGRDGNGIDPTRICTVDGWCWHYPQLATNDILGAWVNSATDAWLATRAGVVVHWDGTRFSGAPTGVKVDLRSVWAADGQHAWAVGDRGVVLHWHGEKWTQVLPEGSGNNLFGVWGAAPEIVFAVGDNATNLRIDFVDPAYDITSLDSDVQAVSLRAVFGFGVDDVWIAGASGTIAHYTGDRYLITPAQATTTTLRSVWGASPTDVWAVGDNGARQHWTGGPWTSMNSTPGYRFVGVSGIAANDVWLVDDSLDVWQWDGAQWQIAGVGAGGVSNCIAAGRAGSPGPGGPVWVGSDNGELYERVAAHTWSRLQEPSRNFYSVVSIAPDDTWALGDAREIGHWDGSQWSFVSTDLFGNLHAAWGEATDNVWAVGNILGYGLVGHYDGVRWNGIAAPAEASADAPALHGVAGAGGAVYVVGDGGACFTWTGSSWTTSHINTTEDLTDIAATSQSNIWIVGQNGVVRYWDGTLIERDLPSGSGESAVWSPGPNAAWVTNSAGSVWQWQVDHWTERRPSPSTTNYRDIWGRGSDEVWVLADWNRIFHWDGASWSEEQTGTENFIRAIGGVSTGTGLWAVGDLTTILHKQL